MKSSPEYAPKSTDGISLAVFDMDGLLFDTENLFLRLVSRSEEELGYTIPESLHYEAIGRTFEDVKELFRKHFGDTFPFEEFFTRTKQRVNTYIEERGMPLKKGVENILLDLSERGVALSLASSSPRWLVEQNLKAAQMEARFPLVMCGDEVTKGKPAPDIFLMAAEKAGIPAEKCIVFEDSNNGIRAASAAGMRSIMVPDIKSPEDDVKEMVYRIYDSLEEVRANLDDLLTL